MHVAEPDPPQSWIARRCWYAHSVEELREKKFPVNYKTMRCRHFSDGLCVYGEKCMFLHEDDSSLEPSRPGLRVFMHLKGERAVPGSVPP